MVCFFCTMSTTPTAIIGPIITKLSKKYRLIRPRSKIAAIDAIDEVMKICLTLIFYDSGRLRLLILYAESSLDLSSTYLKSENTYRIRWSHAYFRGRATHKIVVTGTFLAERMRMEETCKMTQNTQTKIAEESSLSARPIEDETRLLREELEAERDSHLRLAAEYKNYRRRIEQENTEAADRGKRELLMQLVSLADDLDRAVAGLNETPEAVAAGVRMIHRRFRDILEANTVVAFESEGEKFDPERHEAFAVVAGGERESGMVHEQMRRGYFWKDRLFRPALVVVEQ